MQWRKEIARSDVGSMAEEEQKEEGCERWRRRRRRKKKRGATSEGMEKVVKVWLDPIYVAHGGMDGLIHTHCMVHAWIRQSPHTGGANHPSG